MATIEIDNITDLNQLEAMKAELEKKIAGLKPNQIQLAKVEKAVKAVLQAIKPMVVNGDIPSTANKAKVEQLLNDLHKNYLVKSSSVEDAVKRGRKARIQQ